MLAHDIRGWYSWYGTRGINLPTNNLKVLLACDYSRGAVWQNGIWYNCIQSRGVSLNTFMWGKNRTCWHSSTLAECLRCPNSGCEHGEVVGGAFHQWQQSCERQAVFWAALLSCQLTKWRVPWSAYTYNVAYYNQGIMNSDRYITMLSWRSKFAESGDIRKQYFSCIVIISGYTNWKTAEHSAKFWLDCLITPTI
jgi:hypothetical protein